MALRLTGAFFVLQFVAFAIHNTAAVMTISPSQPTAGETINISWNWTEIPGTLSSNGIFSFVLYYPSGDPTTGALGGPGPEVDLIIANLTFPGVGAYTAYGITIPQTVKNMGNLYWIYATNGSDIEIAWDNFGPITINNAASTSTTTTTGVVSIGSSTASSSLTSASGTASTTSNSATNANTISTQAQGSPTVTQGTSKDSSTTGTSGSHLKVLIGAIIGGAAILAIAVIITAYFVRRQRHPRRKDYKYSGVDIDPRIIAASVVTPFSDESRPPASEELLVPPTLATHGLTPQASVSSLQEKAAGTVSETSLQAGPISGPSTSSGMSSASFFDPGLSGSDIAPPLKLQPSQPLLVVGDLDTDSPPEYSPSPFHSFNEPPPGKRS
ncbi:hypothetical protein H0H92_010642 [Tricholoma furcatifolium]|nr:hypothetical protein H0H92_010642 [Tricholoma furcatifolium]